MSNKRFLFVLTVGAIFFCNFQSSFAETSKNRTVYRFDYGRFREQISSNKSASSVYSGSPISKLNEMPAIINSSSGKFFTTNVHKQITEKALHGKVSEACLNIIISANTSQDDDQEFKNGRNHFDDNLICESYKLMQERGSQIANSKDAKSSGRLLGQMLHAVQDFYSHANYIELYLERKNVNWTAIETINFNELCDAGKRKNLTGNAEILNELFTAFFHGHEATNLLDEMFLDLPDPKSHLTWNKDLPPVDDFWSAFFASRSSFKKPDQKKPETYFDIVFDLQVRHSIDIFENVSTAFVGKSCK